jgi:D-lactate dehydrogenase
MKVLFYSAQKYDEKSFTLMNSGYGYELSFLEAHLNPETAKLAQGYDVISAFVNDDLSAATLEALKNSGVRLIAMRCAGYNNIDLEAAKRLDLELVRVPEYSPYAVAEHSAALVLGLNRKTHKAYNRVRENNFRLAGLQGFDLHGKTIGIIGCGKIGRVAVDIFKGFGMQVLVCDPFLTEEIPGVKKKCLDELLSNSDIISLYCPLTKETKHLINDDAIKKMRDGVMLINTSRGALVDTRAVIRGLKSGKIAYLGIDVYEEEAGIFFEDHTEAALDDDVLARLMTFPNVLITGHQAFFTKEALAEIAKVSLENIKAFSSTSIDDTYMTRKVNF